MKKITIVGVTHSGKTCYFYGMLHTMLVGLHGFSLRIKPGDFNRLRPDIKRLADSRLPLEERFPQASSETQFFDMDLLYNYNKLTDFQWVDYPGEKAEANSEDFVELLADTSCLLLCVDGEAIQGTEADIPNIVRDIQVFRDGISVNSALSLAAEKNENGLPPVCVIITKYDMVSEELRKEQLLVRIIKEVFPNLFNAGIGNRIVTICPVTLGKEILIGGRMDPKNMEKPICFANYWIQNELLSKFIEACKGYTDAKQAAIDEYNRRGILGKIFTPTPTPITEEEKKAIETVMTSMKENLDYLRSVIEGLKLYMNGEEIPWPD